MSDQISELCLIMNEMMVGVLAIFKRALFLLYNLVSH